MPAHNNPSVLMDDVNVLKAVSPVGEFHADFCYALHVCPMFLTSMTCCHHRFELNFLNDYEVLSSSSYVLFLDSATEDMPISAVRALSEKSAAC